MKKKFTIEVDIDTEEIGRSYKISDDNSHIMVFARKADPEMLRDLGVDLTNPDPVVSLMHELGHAIGDALEFPAHTALMLSQVQSFSEQYALVVEAEKEAWGIVGGELPDWNKRKTEAIKAYERVLKIHQANKLKGAL